jgi:hypothetical protein
MTRSYDADELRNRLVRQARRPRTSSVRTYEPATAACSAAISSAAPLMYARTW